MDHFTPVDTLNASNFLREVVQPDGSAVLHFLMPVTGFEDNGQPVSPTGFDKEFGLYPTIDATHPAGQTGVGGVFSGLNVTLWADPKNDAETPGVSETSGPSFSNGIANDIVLATGTMVSALVSLDPTTMTRSADDVVTMTPTLDGTLLLDGSIKSGTLLEVKTVPGNGFRTIAVKRMHFIPNVRTVVLASAMLMAGVTQSYANCDNGSLSGVYPFVANGFTVGIYDSSGVLQRLTPPQPLSSVGQFTFDGQGTFTRVDFNIGNGVPANNASTPVNESGFRIGQTGTYSISEDCTGRLALSVSGALIQYQLVVVDFGESARAIIASEHVPGFPNPPPGTDCSAGCDEGVNILVDLKKDVYRRSR